MTAARPSRLLAVRDLAVSFRTEEGVVQAVDGVSFDLDRGEVLGLVGESGSGKSVTGLALLGLLPRPPAVLDRGRIAFDGEQIAAAPERVLRTLRGRRIAMVFQDPMTSLNPYLRVEEQLVEVARLHLGLGRRDARRRALDTLREVGLPDPERRIRSYPHEFSGGMRQRVLIAMALLCDPELLIADEPTTALDVTVQAQILDLLRGLRDRRGLAVLLITHDLGVVAGLADRVLVLYAGRVLEEAPADLLFGRPLHPYTRALLDSVPRLGGEAGRLASLEGMPPQLGEGPVGACTLAPRCSRVVPACREGEPSLVAHGPGRACRCLRPLEEGS